MSMLDSALYLASLGFHVFPGEIVTAENGKLVKKPMWRGWKQDATCDLAVIERIWRRVSHALPFISTSYYTNGTLWHLNVIDVDNKEDRCGSASLGALGFPLPVTFTQRTPTGGFHLIYKTTVPVGNTVGVLGIGLDTRGWGGVLAGAGSETPSGVYTIAVNEPVAEAPPELALLVGPADTRAPWDGELPEGVNEEAAYAWAEGYLKSLPMAMNGTIDDYAFAAACALQNRGLSPDAIHDAMLEHFKSELPVGRLEDIARHAHRYAKDAPGSRAPEILFKNEVKKPANPPAAGGVESEEAPSGGTPIDYFNKDHAFVLGGSSGNILMEDFDSHSKPLLRIMGLEAFHNLNLGLTFTDGDGKTKPLSRVWMNSRNRRTYRGLEFAPGRELPPTYYNLWRGFAHEPQPIDEEPGQRSKDALANYLYLVHHHISHGDEVVNKYLITWAAQMIQDPQNRPFVCPVIRGGKGTGKDTFLDVLGGLLGPHYWLTSEKEDLVGRFNEQLGKILLFGLNEAFWHGDHAVESKLKHMITGDTLRIEQKFCVPYQVDNLMRICIMGNADILVPATDDERRWLVTDTRAIEPHETTAFYAFCGEIRAGMKAGGYRLLLRYLMDYDITQVNLGFAPNTQGLVDQKEAGLTPVQQYVRECIAAGAIVGCSVPVGWPEKVAKDLFRDAFRRWARDHNIGGREPGEQIIGRQINKMKLGIDGTQKIAAKDGKQTNAYGLPSLEMARKNWDVYIKAVKPTVW
jgi:hypothetical protein